MKAKKKKKILLNNTLDLLWSMKKICLTISFHEVGKRFSQTVPHKSK